MLKVVVSLFPILFTYQSGAANAEVPAILNAAQGEYRLDREASSSDCREPDLVRVQIRSDRQGLSIRNSEAKYGGEIYAISENKNSDWDNVYDLYMFWAKYSDKITKNRAYQETVMVSPFGFEKTRKKFYFLNAGDHPFIISSQTKSLSYDYGYETKSIHCVYKRALEDKVNETEAK